jgi:hypothetical protein
MVAHRGHSANRIGQRPGQRGRWRSHMRSCRRPLGHGRQAGDAWALPSALDCTLAQVRPRIEAECRIGCHPDTSPGSADNPIDSRMADTCEIRSGGQRIHGSDLRVSWLDTVGVELRAQMRRRQRDMSPVIRTARDTPTLANGGTEGSETATRETARPECEFGIPIEREQRDPTSTAATFGQRGTSVRCQANTRRCAPSEKLDTDARQSCRGRVTPSRHAAALLCSGLELGPQPIPLGPERFQNCLILGNAGQLAAGVCAIRRVVTVGPGTAKQGVDQSFHLNQLAPNVVVLAHVTNVRQPRASSVAVPNCRSGRPGTSGNSADRSRVAEFAGI